MLEVHPFGNFIPSKVKYLMLGSFTSKPQSSYEWFYANGRNLFWPIMEEVYGLELRTKARQEELFEKMEMALADIIFSCERRKNSSLDANLFNITFNKDGIKNIVINKHISKIFFTSRNVENLYRKHFKDVIEHTPDIELITLPSPSPRYAAMRKEDKVKRYKELLPTIKVK